jgi:hypothetical protein
VRSPNLAIRMLEYDVDVSDIEAEVSGLIWSVGYRSLMSVLKL